MLALATTFALAEATPGYSITHVHLPTPVQAVLAIQPPPKAYIVASGDNLAKIAAKHNLDPATGWRLLYDANPSITNPDLVEPGQQLRIPAPGEQVPPRPVTARASEETTLETTLVSARDSKPPTDGSVWDRLAQCESSGNWSSNVGLFDGGLQFHPGTWKAYGGTQYASSANHATREQQIAIAKRVLAGQGWRAWPACSRKLGLR